MRKIENSAHGYTLIELLAVMLILIALGTIIASIFVSSLRGGNKSTTTNDIRQSGNYAVSQMSKMIAYAKKLNGLSTDGTSGSFTTDCVQKFINGNPQAPDVYKYVQITSFDDGETTTTFSCTPVTVSGTTYGILSSNSANLNPPPAIISSALIPDTMDATTCSFTCNQTNILSPITININLTLQKRQSGSTLLLPEAQTKMNFDTSVTARNSP
jgi:type II secretory pathway pseudopilin PulG